MIKFSFPIPAFLARWLFPRLIGRAKVHGSASENRRSKNGILEVVAVAKMDNR